MDPASAVPSLAADYYRKHAAQRELAAGTTTPAPGTELGKFLAPHGLAVDSRGDVYVGEVSWTAWPQIYPDTPRPDHIRSLQKFEKVG